MLVNTPQVGDWTWVDAIQMGMPVLAKMGHLTGEQKYFDKMWDMYEFSRNQLRGKGLFNLADGLWWRDADFLPPYKEPNGEDCYWSRGNGWAYAALVRVLDEIPANEKHRQDYINDFLLMSKALKACQRTDGFWNVSLHDAGNYGGKETTGTALFVYGMAWGVRNGLLDKEEYFDKMWDMYEYTRNKHGENGMYNQKEGLWWRDQDFDPPYKEPNGKNCYWSRGNGWVYAALVRVLDEIPTDEKHRADYINDFLTMSKAIKNCQRTDGFWNVSMHDESNFGGKETSGTALFVYGMAWGVRNGLLDRKEYLPVLLKAWNAMVKDAVHPNGFIGLVQGTGKEPKDSQPVTYDKVPDFEDFGVGCFLLAGSEVYKLN